MNEELFEARYDVSKKSRLKKIYEKNKILIFSTTIIFLIIVIFLGVYAINKEKKNALLADNYIEAKIYLEAGEKVKAINALKNIVLSDSTIYSALSLFLILNENLIVDESEILSLFNHLLKNNKFEDEIKNLIIFKKAIFQSNSANELELIETAKPLLNAETLWKPHILLLLGDFFVSKNQNLKAKEFYTKVLSLKNLNKELYDHARSQLILTTND
mgnify:FL=1